MARSETRLTNLAVTGRITEQEYRTLVAQRSRAAAIANGTGAGAKTPGSTGNAERAQAADQKSTHTATARFWQRSALTGAAPGHASATPVEPDGFREGAIQAKMC